MDFPDPVKQGKDRLQLISNGTKGRHHFGDSCVKVWGAFPVKFFFPLGKNDQNFGYFLVD